MLTYGWPMISVAAVAAAVGISSAAADVVTPSVDVAAEIQYTHLYCPLPALIKMISLNLWNILILKYNNCYNK